MTCGLVKDPATRLPIRSLISKSLFGSTSSPGAGLKITVVTILAAEGISPIANQGLSDKFVIRYATEDGMSKSYGLDCMIPFRFASHW